MVEKYLDICIVGTYRASCHKSDILMRCESINSLYEETKIFINVDSEKFLFRHMYTLYVFNTCLYSKWTRFFCSLFCPNEYARSLLHMNIYFVLPAQFFNITKFSLQIVFNDINGVIVCMYSCIICI